MNTILFPIAVQYFPHISSFQYIDRVSVEMPTNTVCMAGVAFAVRYTVFNSVRAM